MIPNTRNFITLYCDIILRNVSTTVHVTKDKPAKPTTQPLRNRGREILARNTDRGREILASISPCPYVGLAKAQLLVKNDHRGMKEQFSENSRSDRDSRPPFLVSHVGCYPANGVWESRKARGPTCGCVCAR
jgi:hypothetical protein